MIIYVICIVIIFIYLLIIFDYIINKYLTSLLNSNINNIIDAYSRNDENIITEFIIKQGSFNEGNIDRVLNGINDSVFVFLSNLKINDIISYGGNNAILTFPANNITNNIKDFIYGGYFIIANDGDFICVKSNEARIKRFNDENNILYFLKYNDSNINSLIMCTNILFKSKELLLINIRIDLPDNSLDENYYNIFGKILLYLKTYIINDKEFIISGIFGINSKFMDLAISNVFNDNVISSCYSNVFTTTKNNIYVQSSFIIINKNLCPNGARFGVEYLEMESSDCNFVLYAKIYNRGYNLNYFNDSISTEIYTDYKYSTTFSNAYIDWNNINTDNLSSSFDIDTNTLTDIEEKAYNRRLLVDLIG